MTIITNASFTTDFVVALLISFSVSLSLGVFLPFTHSRTRSLRLGLDFTTPQYDLRGGADLINLPDEGAAELRPKQLVSSEDPIPSIDDTEFLYSTVGVINVPTSHGVNNILMCYKLNGSTSSQIHETWGLPATYTDDAKNDLALAETTGCLCHGIVLNLTSTASSSSISSQQLDDILLCLAKGIKRRSKGALQMTIPVAIICEGASSSSMSEIAVKYVQRFLTCAFYHLHFSKTGAIDNDMSEDSLLQQYNVLVRYSDTSAVNTAADMARTMLQQFTAEGMRSQNFVSRILFGTLCSQLYHEISNDDFFVEWRQLAEYSHDMNFSDREACASEKFQSNLVEQQISADLRQKVEFAMAAAFIDAEESMIDIESRIDNSFLELGGDETTGGHPFPEFGGDVDSIVEAMSSSFLAILQDNDLSESEKSWVNDQRSRALNQLVGKGIYRLFHLRLQSLRDYFGHYYEFMLDGSVADHSNNWNLRRRKAARYAEEQFTKAAVESIPKICKSPEGELSDDIVGMFSCVEALGGLLEDMEEVTATRDNEENEWRDITSGLEDESNGGIDSLAISHSRLGLRQLIKRVRNKVQRNGPARWYERLAAKVLVIGVNYVQGWLVLHALRREAKKRDMEMPKFPLF